MGGLLQAFVLHTHSSLLVGSSLRGSPSSGLIQFLAHLSFTSSPSVSQLFDLELGGDDTVGCPVSEAVFLQLCRVSRSEARGAEARGKGKSEFRITGLVCRLRWLEGQSPASQLSMVLKNQCAHILLLGLQTVTRNTIAESHSVQTIAPGKLQGNEVLITTLREPWIQTSSSRIANRL